MKLSDLKERATASELTLIEKVEERMGESSRRAMSEYLTKWTGLNPPPLGNFSMGDLERFRGWYGRFQEVLANFK